MLDIIEQIIKFYLQYKKAPDVSDLKLEDASLMEEKKSIFITLYKNGEVAGSSGCINGNKRPLISELIDNTVYALEKDDRFEKLELKDLESIKVRLDIIESRDVLDDKENTLEKLDPSKSGILAIKKDYENIALILPNIHPILLTGEDFKDVLQKKLDEKKFQKENYLLFEIKTQVHRNF